MTAKITAFLASPELFRPFHTSAVTIKGNISNVPHIYNIEAKVGEFNRQDSLLKLSYYVLSDLRFGLLIKYCVFHILSTVLTQKHTSDLNSNFQALPLFLPCSFYASLLLSMLRPLLIHSRLRARESFIQLPVEIVTTWTTPSPQGRIMQQKIYRDRTLRVPALGWSGVFHNIIFHMNQRLISCKNAVGVLSEN